MKEIERNLTELEETILKTNKYYDYDDIECRGITDVRDYSICQSVNIIISQ